MDRVLIQQRCPGGGSATSFHFGGKIMWASYLCLIAVSFHFLEQPAEAEPILASSLGFCQNIEIHAAPGELDCCLPPPKTIVRKDFVLPESSVLRERKPAHVLAKDPEYVKKYNEAYTKMRALKRGDPLSFDTQWKTHCAFCSDAFLQKSTNGTEIEGVLLQVHYSWMFLPWHRMYLYFHERILGKLINDTTFALPFWNWDNQLDPGAMEIPALFLPGFSVNGSAVNNTGLISMNRNPQHMPPVLLSLLSDAALEKAGRDPNRTDAEIKEDNLAYIYTNTVLQVTSTGYLGGNYSLGTSIAKATGRAGGAETLHNPTHTWVGLPNNSQSFHPDKEDMGNLIFSGKDPLFYTHHCNVDRLWNVWKTLPDTVTPSGKRRRVDHPDTDFLDSEFTFFDEEGDMVVVKVRDTLDSTKLGYTYTNMDAADTLWRNYTPKDSPSRATEQTWNPTDYAVAAPTTNNSIFDSPVSYMVVRRLPNGTDLIGKPVKHVNELVEEVLMESLRVPQNLYVRLDAFLNLPSADKTTDFTTSAYVGSFSHLPTGTVNTTDGDFQDPVNADEQFVTTDVHFTVGPSLSRQGITDYNTPITITIVPRMSANSSVEITFSSLRQDFQ